MADNTCSIGILAFNEAENIAGLIDDLLNQATHKFCIREILVVVSGCTDGTGKIVADIENESKTVRLLTQEKRLGKASAINLFISQAKGDFLVIVNADTRLKKDAVERVLLPLLDPAVGMTGGKPVPVNEPDTFLGYGVQLLWCLHHAMALKKPKLGELIAFRNCIAGISVETTADEAALEAMFAEKGLSLRYVPEAVVYNRGAKTIGQFLSQRERNFIGHLWVRKQFGYSVASLDSRLLCRVVKEYMFLRPRYFYWTIGIVLLELTARLSGVFKFAVLKKNPYVWQTVPETKIKIELPAGETQPAPKIMNGVTRMF